MEQAPLATLQMSNGIEISARVQVDTDWPNIRVLAETGVPFAELARIFKVEEKHIKDRSNREKWLTPLRATLARKKLAKLQKENYEATGRTMEVGALKAEMWRERSEEAKELIWEKVMTALEQADPAVIANMLVETKDLANLLGIVTKITGEDQEEKAKGPSLAINIGLLSQQAGPIEVDAVDAEVVDQ